MDRLSQVSADRLTTVDSVYRRNTVVSDDPLYQKKDKNLTSLVLHSLKDLSLHKSYKMFRCILWTHDTDANCDRLHLMTSRTEVCSQNTDTPSTGWTSFYFPFPDTGFFPLLSFVLTGLLPPERLMDPGRNPYVSRRRDFFRTTVLVGRTSGAVTRQEFGERGPMRSSYYTRILLPTSQSDRREGPRCDD